MDPRMARIKKELGDHFANTEEGEARAKREYLEGDASRIEAEKQLLEGSGIIQLLQEIRYNRIVMFSKTALASVEVIIPTVSFVEVEFRDHATVALVFNDASWSHQFSEEGGPEIRHDQVKIQAVDGGLFLEVPCSHHSETPSGDDWKNTYYRLSHRYDLQAIDPANIDDEVIAAIKTPFKYSNDIKSGFFAVPK